MEMFVIKRRQTFWFMRASTYPFSTVLVFIRSQCQLILGKRRANLGFLSPFPPPKVIQVLVMPLDTVRSSIGWQCAFEVAFDWSKLDKSRQFVAILILHGPLSQWRYFFPPQSTFLFDSSSTVLQKAFWFMSFVYNLIQTIFFLIQPRILNAN